MELGARLAAAIRAGDVVALRGELGAGKTHLTKGLCGALGVPPDQVVSPTFTIVNEYAGRDLMIYHIDAYRIDRVEEFFELGFEDYFYSHGLCLIEWPERIESLLPTDAVHLQLAHVAPDRRRVELVHEGRRTTPAE